MFDSQQKIQADNDNIDFQKEFPEKERPQTKKIKGIWGMINMDKKEKKEFKPILIVIDDLLGSEGMASFNSFLSKFIVKSRHSKIFFIITG